MMYGLCTFTRLVVTTCNAIILHAVAFILVVYLLKTYHFSFGLKTPVLHELPPPLKHITDVDSLSLYCNSCSLHL